MQGCGVDRRWNQGPTISSTWFSAHTKIIWSKRYSNFISDSTAEGDVPALSHNNMITAFKTA